jgi:hypothetical protein
LIARQGLAVLLGAPIAEAQESPPVRVRGTIEQVDGPNLAVKSRDGAELKSVRGGLVHRIGETPNTPPLARLARERMRTAQQSYCLHSFNQHQCCRKS